MKKFKDSREGSPPAVQQQHSSAWPSLLRCRLRTPRDIKLTAHDESPFFLCFFLQGERRAAFTFDRVFNMETTQQEVYDYAAKDVVEGECTYRKPLPPLVIFSAKRV